MKAHTSSAALKARARASLMGHYLTLSGAFLTLIILQYVITVPPALMQASPPFGMILYYGASLALELFFAVFQVGIAYMFLSNACGQPVNSGGLFAGFRNNPAKAAWIQLFPSLLLLLPNILPDVLLRQYAVTAQTRWLIYSLILTLIFLPYIIYVRILYSQVFYVMLDFPDMDARECLRYSRRLMKGHKARYLYLLLSFLPMTILGIMSFGIGLLYVYPYQQQTCANFYLDLVSNRRS